MELYNNTTVKFDALTHSYFTNGNKRLIGVTSLMAKHELSPNYSNVLSAVLKKAAERGTAVHKLIEAYDNGETVEETPELTAYRKLGLKIVASEYLVSDNEFVASSIDKVVFVDENTVDLADIKTTSVLHKEAVNWQLSIYKYLFLLQNPHIKVRNLFAIWVRNGKAQIENVGVEIPVKEIQRLFKCEREGVLYVEGEHVLPVEARALVANLVKINELKATIKALEDACSQETDKVMEYMQKRGLKTLTEPEGTFTLKDSYTREAVDTKALKEKEPDIYKRFIKTSTVKPSLSFKVS